MNNSFEIRFFEGKRIRVAWDAKQEKYYFAVSDIVQALTDSKNPRDYIKRMLQQNPELKSQWGTICFSIEMLASNGKSSKILATDLKGAFRIIESISSSISSKKVESLHQCLVKIDGWHNGQKTIPKNNMMKIKCKNTIAYILKIFFLAFIPCIMLVYQENNPNSQIWGLTNLDNLSDFHELYNNDTCVIEDNDVLFLDISSDMIAIQSSDGKSLKGTSVNCDILIRFLQKAKDLNYQAIFIDASFDKKLISNEDAQKLAKLLEEMDDDPRKVFIVNDSGITLPDELANYSIWGRCEPNEFGVLVRSHFIYDFNNLGSNENSAAFRIYRSTHEPNYKTMKSLLFPFYYHDKHIVRNNPIVKILHPSKYFEIKDFSLSSFLEETDDSIKNGISDKIIFIGDFKSLNDQHFTYAEKIPGIYMIYCEYEAIKNGNFLLSYRMLLWLFLAYCLITAILLFNRFSDGFKFLAKLTEKFINKIELISFVNLFKKVNVVFFAVLDVFFRFFIVIVILDIITSCLYVYYDFLYSSTLPKYWFTLIEVLAVYNYNVNFRKSFKTKISQS